MHRTQAAGLAVVCGFACTGAAAPVAAATFTVLHSFQNGGDGAFPEAALLDVGGTLYGTTAFGGAARLGTVFSLNLTTGAYTVLHSFRGGSDGSKPEANLIKVGTRLYGTTDQGGGSATCSSSEGSVYGCGTVFSLNPATGAEKVVYAFQGGSDGAGPLGGLLDVGGTLYGTTFLGGSGGGGTVFSLNPKTNAEKVISSFVGVTGYGGPAAGLINVGGTLYGTTTLLPTVTNGTVFSLDLTTGAQNTVYSFTGDDVDLRPVEAGVIKVGAKLYGTTCAAHGVMGSVFSLDPATGAEAVVSLIPGGFSSFDYVTSLVRIGPSLYGTTSYGGGSYNGTVFSVNPATGRYRVVYAFQGASDGSHPQASLINVGGTLYGTAYRDGTSVFGTVFALTP